MTIEPPVALSLSRPWPWAFLLEKNPKLIENRQRKDGKMPPMCRYRGELFLHAAISWDPDAGPWMQSRGLLCHEDPATRLMFSDMRLRGRKKARDEHHPPSVIFARCNVVGHIEPHGSTSAFKDDRPIIYMGPPDGQLGRLGSTDRVTMAPWSDDGPDLAVAASALRLDLRWWMGGFALVLADVKPTPHVFCKGNRGLWKLPADVLEQLNATCMEGP